MIAAKPETLHRVTVLGEIVSAVGFEAANTYLSFQLLLPEEGWSFEDSNEYEKAMALDQYCEFNKRKGVT